MAARKETRTRMETVLVVEDEKLIRKGLVTMIRRAPTPVETVLEAKNGVEAIEILRSQQVDVLITDIRMPIMDGIELVEKSRSMPHVPLAVVVSGYDDFNYAVKMLRSGVKDYLLKPVEREKLWGVLEKLDTILSASEKEKKSADALWHQSLRYLMFDGSIPAEERQKILERYSAQFGKKPYRVLCATAEPKALPQSNLLRDAYGRYVAVLDAGIELPVLRGGISEPHTGLDSLHTAYTEALAACQHAFFDDAATLRYEHEPVKSTPVSEREIQKIVQLLGTGRWKESCAVLQALADNVRLGKLSPDDFGTAMQQLCKQILSTYRTMLNTDEADLNLIANPWQYDCIESYLSVVSDWMDQFAYRLLHEFEDYRNKQKIRDAVLYIQKNYASALNMALVSNEVDMNYSLFSLLFKQYVGTNFVAYLQGVRINAAKTLLRESNLRVNEIGRKVGFADEKNFLKVFKSTEGISPTEYRRANQFGQ